jgi:nucleoside-diphosphate-sugar epimerase
MHIFLTGGTGFIGRHLLAALTNTEHRVTALCRQHSLLAFSHPRLTWICKAMDNLDPTDLAGVDVLVHLASPGVPPQQAEWTKLFYWNVTVLLQLMTTAKQAGVRRGVLAGSSTAYGRSADFFDFIPHDAPLLPTYGYAASKAAGFACASAFATENKMELCYLRIFSAFGDGQYSENFWPSLRHAALRNEDFSITPGEQIRDYIPVERVVQAFHAAIERQDVVAGIPWVRNLGSGQPISILQFATTWWATWNARSQLRPGALPYRPGEIMRCVPVIDPTVWEVPQR